MSQVLFVISFDVLLLRHVLITYTITIQIRVLVVLLILGIDCNLIVGHMSWPEHQSSGLVSSHLAKVCIALSEIDLTLSILTPRSVFCTSHSHLICGTNVN